MILYRYGAKLSLCLMGLGLVLLSSLFTGPLEAQARVSKSKHEFGFSIDITSPRPGSEWEGVLKPNIGLGFFYRNPWPKPLYSEAGLLWSFLESKHSQKMVMFPFYYALAYPAPLETRLDLLVKLGFGSAYIEVQPNDMSGWDPFLLLGSELSILASRSFRIGMRLDYLHIYEKHLDPPEDVENSPPAPAHVDPRFQNRQDFRIVNGEFIRFGILFSFIF